MKSFSRFAKKCTFILLCMVIVLMSASCEKNDAINDFNVLNRDILQLQTGISTKLTECQTLLSETNDEDLADPALLNQLKTNIDSANNITINFPTVASDTTSIKKQIQDQTIKKEELQQISSSLSDICEKIQASKQDKIAQIAAEKESAIQEAITPKDIHIIYATDSNGNKEKITLCIGKWIKGSEIDTIEKAWSIVGGTGSMPLTGKFSRSDAGWTEGTFTQNDAAYVFGTISIENMTPDFDAKNFGNGNSKYCIKLSIQEEKSVFSNGWEDADNYLSYVVGAVQYKNDTVCQLANYGYLISANMESNNWGPVPIVIGVDTVFSPKYPNGDPWLDKVYFRFGGACLKLEDYSDFQIGRSW